MKQFYLGLVAALAIAGAAAAQPLALGAPGPGAQPLNNPQIYLPCTNAAAVDDVIAKAINAQGAALGGAWLVVNGKCATAGASSSGGFYITGGNRLAIQPGGSITVTGSPSAVKAVDLAGNNTGIDGYGQAGIVDGGRGTGATGAGVYVEPSLTGVYIRGLTVRNVGGNGTSPGPGVVPGTCIQADSDSFITVEGNYTVGCQFAPAFLEQATATTTAALFGWHVLNNRFDQRAEPSTSTTLQPGLLVRGADVSHCPDGALISGNTFLMPTNPTTATLEGAEVRFACHARYVDNHTYGGSIGHSLVDSPSIYYGQLTCEGTNLECLEVAGIYSSVGDGVAADGLNLTPLAVLFDQGCTPTCPSSPPLYNILSHVNFINGWGAYFTGSIATGAGAALTGVQTANQLTASSVTGTIQLGVPMGGTGTNSEYPVSQVSGTTGAAGVYTMSQSLTIGSEAMTQTWGTMTVSSVSDGVISPLTATTNAGQYGLQQWVQSGAGSVTFGSYVANQVSGTTGGAGVYTVTKSQTLGSSTMSAGSQYSGIESTTAVQGLILTDVSLRAVKNLFGIEIENTVGLQMANIYITGNGTAARCVDLLTVQRVGIDNLACTSMGGDIVLQGTAASDNNISVTGGYIVGVSGGVFTNGTGGTLGSGIRSTGVAGATQDWTDFGAGQFVELGTTPPTTSGSCTVTTQLGTTTVSTFVASGACAAGTVILTFAHTAKNGWSCDAKDLTTPTDLMPQTGAPSTTSCTLTGNMANGDTVKVTAAPF